MRRRLRPLLPLAVASVLALVPHAAATAQATRVTVTPAAALLDAPFHIRASALRAGEVVQVRVSELAEAGVTLTASKPVRADRHGLVDLPNSSLLGLVRYPPGGWYSVRFPAAIRVSVVSGRRTLASTTARRFVADDSVKVDEERPQQTGFYGEYVRPPATRGHTAILLIGGSEGGLSGGNTAELLASHGYPVLDLAYFSEPGLPSQLQNIPLEYFERALQWLATQPEVDSQKIVVIGGSRGGEGALLIGSVYPQLVHAVAAYVPSEDVHLAIPPLTGPAWTLNGVGLPSQPIEVEKIAGPVFAVGALDDHLWSSANAVLAIKKRLLDHGRSDFTGLVYERAGHGVGLMIPNIPSFPSVNSRYGVLNLGGTTADDQAARRDSWPKLLRFLSAL